MVDIFSLFVIMNLIGLYFHSKLNEIRQTIIFLHLKNEGMLFNNLYITQRFVLI